MFGIHVITEKQLQVVFAIWDMRCKDNPEEYGSTDSLSPIEYGQEATQHFLKLLKEVK